MDPFFAKLVEYVQQAGPIGGVIFLFLWWRECKKHDLTKDDLKALNKEYTENLKTQGKETITVLAETEKTMSLLQHLFDKKE